MASLMLTAPVFDTLIWALPALACIVIVLVPESVYAFGLLKFM